MGEQIVDYDMVVESLRALIGQRMSVSVESADPNAAVAMIVGVLKADQPQTSPYVSDREEGIVFALETSPDLPDSTFSIWRHPTGVGSKSDIGVGWRVGSTAVIVHLLPEAYGFPT